MRKNRYTYAIRVMFVRKREREKNIYIRVENNIISELRYSVERFAINAGHKT